jgi:hypothetical protein
MSASLIGFCTGQAGRLISDLVNRSAYRASRSVRVNRGVYLLNMVYLSPKRMIGTVHDKVMIATIATAIKRSFRSVFLLICFAPH